MNYQQKETLVVLLWEKIKYVSTYLLLPKKKKNKKKNRGVLTAFSFSINSESLVYWMGQKLNASKYMIVQWRTNTLCIYIEANLHMQCNWCARYRSLDFGSTTGFFECFEALVFYVILFLFFKILLTLKILGRTNRNNINKQTKRQECAGGHNNYCHEQKAEFMAFVLVVFKPNFMLPQSQ